MRSAILIFLAGLTFAATPARAQSTSLERNMIRTCLQLSRMIAATNWTAARKFRASLS